MNFTGEPATITLDGRWMVEVDSAGGTEGTGFSGRLLGDQAVVLRPA